MKRDRRTGEPIVLDLPHSTAVYQRQYRFPFGYLWCYPEAARAALWEIMPWEALAVSLCVCVAVWFEFGQDLAVTSGVCLGLALVTLQLFRTRAFATPSRIVRERGLFVLSRSETAVAGIQDGRIEYPFGAPDSFGDIVLVTRQGLTRLRAVSDPEAVLDQLLALRASATGTERRA